jgi:ribonuclease D
VLAQNLLASDVVRRLTWDPPQSLDEDTVRARLTDLGARPWQIDLAAAPLSAALAASSVKDS